MLEYGLLSLMVFSEGGSVALTGDRLILGGVLHAGDTG